MYVVLMCVGYFTVCVTGVFCCVCTCYKGTVTLLTCDDAFMSCAYTEVGTIRGIRLLPRTPPADPPDQRP